VRGRHKGWGKTGVQRGLFPASPSLKKKKNEIKKISSPPPPTEYGGSRLLRNTNK